MRLAGTSRLQRGQRFFQCARGFALADLSLAFALGVTLSALTTAHCGWMPSFEYDVVPQTGHTARSGSKTFGLVWPIERPGNGIRGEGPKRADAKNAWLTLLSIAGNDTAITGSTLFSHFARSVPGCALPEVLDCVQSV
jgi:hypothetical protein